MYIKPEDLVLLTAIFGSTAFPVSAFEELGEVSLKPMEKPEPLPMKIGDKWYWLKSGYFDTDQNNYIIYYEKVNTEKYSTRDSDGCTWTRMTGMFAPALEWYDCYQERSGIHEIIDSIGNPWPLSRETKFQYEFTGKWIDGFGANWHETRSCKVDKQIRVTVPAGEFDTHKMVCEDPSLKLTYWISPEVGHHVAFKFENKTFYGRSYLLELIKVVHP